METTTTETETGCRAEIRSAAAWHHVAQSVPPKMPVAPAFFITAAVGSFGAYISLTAYTANNQPMLLSLAIGCLAITGASASVFIVHAYHIHCFLTRLRKAQK